MCEKSVSTVFMFTYMNLYEVCMTTFLVILGSFWDKCCSISSSTEIIIHLFSFYPIYKPCNSLRFYWALYVLVTSMCTALPALFCIFVIGEGEGGYDLVGEAIIFKRLYILKLSSCPYIVAK